MFKFYGNVVLLFVGLMVVLSCGKQSAHNPMQSLGSITIQANLPSNVSGTRNDLPSFPLDAVQPWEKVDSRGFVSKSQNRSISGLYPDSEYQSGVDRYKDDSVSKENGEAIRLASGNSGEKKIAWAMWRLVMGGTQPGVITLDANLGSADAKYFVAVSDYKRNCWQWLGEFDTPNAIIPMKSGEYLSKLGNAFVVVLSYNGASVDVVGTGAHPITAGDTTPPAEVINPKVAAVPGGLFLNWDKVIAADLAGYQITIGNKPINTLTKTIYALIPYTSGKLTITAMDTSNNASKPVEITVPDPLVSGEIPGICLTTDITGTQRNGKANLKVISGLTGAKYDFDLDGDGVFEVLDNVTGSVSPTYPDTGILRPAVCAIDSSGIVRAFSAVSLIVSSNARPFVDITVDKSYGQAPLDVKYTAEFQDFDGTVTSLWWDANGDGTYEAPIASPKSPTTTSTSLSTIGITNARVRVADNDGATDVANVAVQVAPDPDNKMPIITAISASPNPAIAGQNVSFQVTATDSDGTIASYEWCFPEATPIKSTDTNPSGIVYDIAGNYTATVKVTDDKGGYTFGFVGIAVNTAQNLKHLWPMFGYNRLHTHDINPRGPDTPSVLWTYSTSGAIGSSPAIGFDGTAYFGSLDNNLYAVNKDGHLKWIFKTYYEIHSSPAIDSEGVVYIGSYDHNFYAINSDGSLKWKYHTGAEIESSPTIGDDGTIYIGCRDYKIYAFNPNGSIKWSYTTGDSIRRSSPAIDDNGVIYIGSEDNKLYAINSDGSLKWTFTTGDDIISTPAIDYKGTIYVGSWDNKLYAINPDGSQKWVYTTNDDICSSPALYGDRILIGSHDKKLYNLDNSGKLMWSFATDDIIESSPSCTDKGNIYVGSNDDNLYALDKDGNLIWKYKTGGNVFSSPSIGEYSYYLGGVLYIGSVDGRLYAFVYTDEIYEPDNSKTLGQPIEPTTSNLTQDHNIYPAGDEDWYKFWGTAGLTFEFSSSSTTNYDTTAYIYNENNALQTSDDDSGSNGQFKLSWTCPKFGYYFLKVVGKDPISTGSYSINYNHTYQGIWSQRGRERTHSGRSYFTGPTTNALKWKLLTGADVNSSPAIGTDGTVFVGSDDSYLYAFNSDGTEKWKFLTGAEVFSSPAIGSDGTVYIGSYDSYLYAVNPEGIEKWYFKTGLNIDSSPAIGADGTVYVGSRDKYLYAINPNGTEKWKFLTADWVISSPTIGADGTVYVGDYNGNIFSH